MYGLWRNYIAGGEMKRWEIKLNATDVVMMLVTVVLLSLYPFALLYHKYKDC